MTENALPTQQFVHVREIKDGVVYLKHGGLRQLLIVSGLNFDLKSEAEQELILNTFQNFLNALDFPVQFFIHSRKVNIDGYLERMNARLAEEENELLKIQIREYADFIRTFVEQNAIISKTFFVVIPYESVPMSTGTTGIFDSLVKKKPAKGMKQDLTTQESLRQLAQRVSQVVDGLSENGLRAVPLNTDELIELFYNTYNPQFVEKRGLEIVKQGK
jgi:type IV secretory pathway VirB4 component